MTTATVHNNPCSTTNRTHLNSLTNSCSPNDNRILVPSCSNDKNTRQQNGSSNANSDHNKILQTFNFRANVNGHKNKSPKQTTGPPLKKIALQVDGNNRNTSFGCGKSSNNLNNQSKIFSNNNNSRRLPSLASLNKNSFTSSSISRQCNSPGSTYVEISKNRRNLGSPVSQVPNTLQTPNQIKNNCVDNFKSRERVNSGSPDVVDVTPSRKKSARKFPGPAGLLPKLVSKI